MKYVLWILLLLIIIVLTTIVTFQSLMNRQVEAEVQQLYKNIDIQHNEVITEEDLAILPAPVQEWLKSSGVVGKEKIQAVWLKQKGQMRTEPQAAWMPFTAEQYFNFAEPGFIWYVKVQAAPLIHMAGRDKYDEGRGNMLIKLMSVFKIADAAGGEIDQGAVVRYLAEIMWQPMAALRDYIQWEEVNEQSARATMNYQGVTVSGVFEFDQWGNVVSFSAPRYREQGGQYFMDNWHVEVYEHKDFDGIRIPSKGEAIWKLSDGDFKWFQYEITEIEFNPSEFY